MNETTFRREFVNLVNTFIPFRVHPIENSLTPGMPDLLVIRRGKEPIWVELKVGRGKLRQSQINWIRSHPDEIVMVAALWDGKFYLWKQDKENDDWDTIYWTHWPVGIPQEVQHKLWEQ